MMKRAVSISLLSLVTLSIALPVAAGAADKPGRTTIVADATVPSEGEACPLPADPQSRQARLGRIVFRNKVAVCEPPVTEAPGPSTKGITEKGIKRSEAIVPTAIVPSDDPLPANRAADKTKPPKGVPTKDGGVIAGGVILSPGK